LVTIRVGERPEPPETSVYLTCPRGHVNRYWAVLRGETRDGECFVESITTRARPASQPVSAPQPDASSPDAAPKQATKAAVDEQAETRPGVDDAFWFETSKEWVKTAVSDRDKMAEKVETWIKWIWPIYTAAVGGTTVGVALLKPDFSVRWGIALGLASPVLLIAIVYWCILQAQMPVLGKADVRVPMSLQAHHNNEVKVKQGWLTAALVVGLVATLAVTFAAGFALVGRPPRPAPVPDFRALYSSGDSADAVGITGAIPTDSAIGIAVRSLPDKTKPKRFLKELGFVPTAAGSLQVSIPVDTLYAEYSVTAKWKDDGGAVRTLTRNVKSTRQGR